MNKYYLELFFYEDKINNKGYQDEPKLELYSKKTKMIEITSNNWNELKRKLIKEYQGLSYILVLEERNTEI